MRKKSNLVLLASVTLGVAPPAALAQWSAKAEAGVVAARGNTHADSANVKLDATRELVKWRLNGGLTAVYASDAAGATGQRWEARSQADHDLHKRGFWFGSVRYEEDRFSGFEYQTAYGSGIGWRFFDDPVTKLAAQLGVGYKVFATRAELADDGITVIPGGEGNDVVANGKVDFEHALSPTAKVLGKLQIEAGADNTFAQQDLSLEVRIIGALALALGLSVRYNSNPPSTFRRTDTLTTLNLVYELE